MVSSEWNTFSVAIQCKHTNSMDHMHVPSVPFSTCVGVLVLALGPDQSSYLVHLQLNASPTDVSNKIVF
jgi:hypothetical protein